MKRFIIKLLLFCFINYLVVYYFCIFYNNENKLEKEILGKVNALKKHVKNNKCYVIAGDSRAERHLIPKIIETKTGVKTINIAIPGGGLISYLPYLNEFDKNKTTFIFSASSWQINDDLLGPENMTLEPYQQLSLFQRLYVYRFEIKKMIKMEDLLIRTTFSDFYRSLFKNQKKYSTSIKLKKSLGYFEVQNEMNINKMKLILHKKTNLIWYKNFMGDGYRFELFKKSIDKLVKSGFKIIVYQPDSSPLFKKMGKKNGMDKIEKEFVKKIETLTKKNIKLTFYNFYDNNKIDLDNKCYYDPQHLNKNGAIKFSNYFAEKILLKKDQ